MGKIFQMCVFLVGTILVTGCARIADQSETAPVNSGAPALQVVITETVDSHNVTMVLVPAGEFRMGSVHGDPDEKPVHPVYLDAFYIDKYEVTNASYRMCVDDGVCLPPTQFMSFTRESYYGNPDFDNFPVMYVTWDMAQNYCSWRGARLPTEAQWEKAARGTDERTYPWGEGIDCQYANYYRRDGAIFIACQGDTTSLGNYSDGQSPYGVFDLTGNVWEWVADWYGESYYAASPTINPTGPSNGQARVIRGGSWYFSAYSVRATNRYWFSPEDAMDSIGFRCARQ